MLVLGRKGRKKDTVSLFTRLYSVAVDNWLYNNVVPCGLSKQNIEKGTVTSCSCVFGGGWGTGRGLRRGFTELILGLSLKRINEFHQVPSFSLHLITIFFLNGPHLLFFFPNNLFTAQSCAFYFPFPPFL